MNKTKFATVDGRLVHMPHDYDASRITAHDIDQDDALCAVDGLGDLLRLMQGGCVSDWDSVPTFGGPAIDDLGVWSWDDLDMSVGTCADDIQLVERKGA